MFCLYFSPIAKLWPRKKVIFKVFVFWRYSKILNSLSCILPILLFKPLPWHISTIGQEFVKLWIIWIAYVFLFRKCILQSWTMHEVFDLLCNKFYLYDIQMKSYCLYRSLVISQNCCFYRWNLGYLLEQGGNEKETNGIWKHLLSSCWNWTIQTFFLQLFQGYSWLH